MAAQVAGLELQLALVTARLQALEAAAGQDGPPAALRAPTGGAAEAACAPAGLQTPRTLSLGQGAGELAPLAALVHVYVQYLASSCSSVSSVSVACKLLGLVCR